MRLSPEQREQEERREAVWLAAVEAEEATIFDLARVAGLSPRRIRERLARARQMRHGRHLPRFEILQSSAGVLTPAVTCSHASIPIPQGELAYCPECHATGCDHWPALQPRSRETPKPEYVPPESTGLKGGLQGKSRRKHRLTPASSGGSLR